MCWFSVSIKFIFRVRFTESIRVQFWIGVVLGLGLGLMLVLNKRLVVFWL